MDGILESMMNMVFGEAFIQDCINSINNSIYDSSGNVHSAIEKLITAMNEPVLAVASVLLVMYLLIELMEKMTSDSFNAEQFVKLLIKFVMGQIIISNAIEWSLVFMSVGSDFITDLLGSIGTTTISLSGLSEAIAEMGFMEKISALVILLLPVLVSFLLRIAVYFMSYSRALEIVVRAAMSPIGFADVVTGGSHSSGFRYMRRMLGISLQGGMMVAVVMAASALLTTGSMFDGEFVLTDIMFLGEYFGIMAAMVGMLGTTKSIAYEVVGA